MSEPTVQLVHAICQAKNEAQSVPISELKCPRIGECLCLPKRDALVWELSKAQAALDMYDAQHTVRDSEDLDDGC